jgi:hypothetical protein
MRATHLQAGGTFFLRHLELNQRDANGHCSSSASFSIALPRLHSPVLAKTDIVDILARLVFSPDLSQAAQTITANRSSAHNKLMSSSARH